MGFFVLFLFSFKNVRLDFMFANSRFEAPHIKVYNSLNKRKLPNSKEI